MEPINIKVLKTAKNFDLDEFNQEFEDMTLLSKIDTSETIHYSVNDEDIYIDTAIVDPQIAGKTNWYDPTKKDWVNPNQDSKKRIIFFTLIDKYTKKILVMRYKNDARGFYCLGGRPKIFESSKHAAVRLFRKLSIGADIQERKLVPILSANIPIRSIKIEQPEVAGGIYSVPMSNAHMPLATTIMNYTPSSKLLHNNQPVKASYQNKDMIEDTVETITTHAGFIYTGKILNPNCMWVSLSSFKNYPDYNFHTYYKHIYHKILQHLY